jgi:hypothetical protein
MDVITPLPFLQTTRGRRFDVLGRIPAGDPSLIEHPSPTLPNTAAKLCVRGENEILHRLRRLRTSYRNAGRENRDEGVFGTDDFTFTVT